MLFGHRGRQESRQMFWGDVTLKEDDEGEEFLEFHERLTKARSGRASSDSRSFTPKQWKDRENPDRCPVEGYIQAIRQSPASRYAEQPVLPGHKTQQATQSGSAEGHWVKTSRARC